MKALILGVAIALVAYLFWLFSMVPTGKDVEDARILREGVESVLRKAWPQLGSQENIVMMKTRKRRLMVVIKNPKPSISHIYDILKESHEEISFDEYDVLFMDEEMRIIESVPVFINAATK